MDTGVTRWAALTCVPFLALLGALPRAWPATPVLAADVDGNLAHFCRMWGPLCPYLGLAAGLFCDRYGPSPTVLVAGVLGFSAFEVLYWIVDGYLGAGPTAAAACFIVGAQTQAAFLTVALVTIMEYFPPEARGRLFGVALALQEIGPCAVLRVIGALAPTPRSLLWALPLLLLALSSPLALALTALSDLSLYRPTQPPSSLLLKVASLLTAVMAMYIVWFPIPD